MEPKTLEERIERIITIAIGERIFDNDKGAIAKATKAILALVEGGCDTPNKSVCWNSYLGRFCVCPATPQKEVTHVCTQDNSGLCDCDCHT